jgi:hypothetical protein
MVTGIVLVLLGTLALPLRALVVVHEDYDQLKALGESGLHHLLAAKAALSPLTEMSTTLQGFSAQPDPSPDMPYTLLVQRQSGTAYTMDVTIHPSPTLTGQGIGTPTPGVGWHALDSAFPKHHSVESAS